MRKKRLLSYEAKIIIGFIVLLLLIFLPIPLLDTIFIYKNKIIDFYNKYIQTFPLWIQIFVLCFPFIIFITIKLIRKNRCKYTEDTFYDVKWKWTWYKDKIVNLQCFCPSCNEELYYDDTTSNFILTVSKVDFICEKCHKVVGSIPNENKNIHSAMIINREIQRIINKKIKEL